jgi:hypothetical protein
VAAGTATVTVTARDPDGAEATLTFVVTVATGNKPPRLLYPISHQTLTVGTAVDVSLEEHITDPEGDEITFTVTSSDEKVVYVGISFLDFGTETMYELVGEAVGSSTITIVAEDANGASLSVSLVVSVLPNRSPTSSAIPNQQVAVGQTKNIDVGSYFSDPDQDDVLGFAVSSSDTAIADVVLAGAGYVAITGVKAGSAVITVTATDVGGSGQTARETFTVTVS